MQGRTLESYRDMFKHTDKDKIIEMNYELSKQLCELEEALNVIYRFVKKEE